MSIFKLMACAIFLGTLNAELRASPPQDLSVFEKPESEDSETLEKKPSRRLKFKEEDLTAGTPPSVADGLNSDSQNSSSPQRKHIRYDVSCRDRPGRQGKPMIKLKSNQVVTEGKHSNQWSEIMHSPKAPPCWVPKSALIN